MDARLVAKIDDCRKELEVRRHFLAGDDLILAQILDQVVTNAVREMNQYAEGWDSC